MGGLIAAVGAALIAGAFERDRASPRVLWIASSLALGGAAAYYASRGRSSKIYLADAAAEATIAAAWLACGCRGA